MRGRLPLAVAVAVSLLGFIPLGGGCTIDAETADPTTEPCPQGICSGHGTCTAVNQRPSCACEVGYAGVTCGVCAASFHRIAGEKCVADTKCTATSCGPKGKCSDVTGEPVCACEPGYSGAQCTDCYAGYHAGGGTAGCVLDRTCLSTSCSGAGQCKDTGGVVVCTCEAGHSGAVCDACATGFYRGVDGKCTASGSCATNNPCGPRGTCEDSSGVARCICQSGYTGLTCATCYPGYHGADGGACELDVPCSPTSCSGRGTCSAATGAPVCTCGPGYDGAQCATCSTGYHRVADGRCLVDETCTGSPCGTRGTCSVTGGVASCACNTGYTGAACAACYGGYHDPGDGTCVLDELCRATSCSRRGQCNDASGAVVCTCDSGFEGTHCETNHDDCASNACGTGRCIDQVNGYICLCLDADAGADGGGDAGRWGQSCP